MLQEDAGLQEVAGRVGVLRVGKTCTEQGEISSPTAGESECKDL